MAAFLAHLIVWGFLGLGVVTFCTWAGHGHLGRALRRDMPRASAAARTAWHWARALPTRRHIAADYDRRVAEAHQRMHDIHFWAARLHHSGPEAEMARQMLQLLPPLHCPCREHVIADHLPRNF